MWSRIENSLWSSWWSECGKALHGYAVCCRPFVAKKLHVRDWDPFCSLQVNVPFTDGYRRNLRHEGHNLNAVHGPLKLFVTANYADVYSPILLSMLLCDSRGNPVAPPAEVPMPGQPNQQCPEMCTLREMHRRVAQCPRTQAKYWLLMDDLVDRYLLGVGHYYVGRRRESRLVDFQHIEDDLCSAAELGLAGFAIDELEPLEAQARGFMHGHRKVYGIPEAMGPAVLQDFRTFSAPKPDDASRGQADAAAPNMLREFLAQASKALIDCARTLQYESATLTAKQMQQTLSLIHI